MFNTNYIKPLKVINIEKFFYISLIIIINNNIAIIIRKNYHLSCKMIEFNIFVRSVTHYNILCN